MGIFVPFALETVKFYDYYQDKVPEGFDWPRLTDFWFTIFMACVFISFEKLINILFYPYYFKICKEKNDEVIRRKRSLKGV